MNLLLADMSSVSMEIERHELHVCNISIQACPAKPCLKHVGRPTSMPICTWQITMSNRWKQKSWWGKPLPNSYCSEFRGHVVEQKRALTKHAHHPRSWPRPCRDHAMKICHVHSISIPTRWCRDLACEAVHILLCARFARLCARFARLCARFASRPCQLFSAKLILQHAWNLFPIRCVHVSTLWFPNSHDQRVMHSRNPAFWPKDASQQELVMRSSFVPQQHCRHLQKSCRELAELVGETRHGHLKSSS